MASREATTTKVLKYIFTEEETKKNAMTLARQTRALEEAEATRKKVVDNLKADESRIVAEIKQHSRYVNDGYDFRDVECKVLYDDPKDGLKTIIRMDTGEPVETLAMEAHERQMTLDLQKQQEEREARGAGREDEADESDDDEEHEDEEEPNDSQRPW